MENKLKDITETIFRFAQFVSETEGELVIQPARYAEIWWELEILNASALSDWETDGSPPIWEKWKEKYQTDALQLAEKLVAERVPENNVVCDVSHFLHFSIQAEAELPHQSRKYADYWWELETFKSSVLEDWERLGKPLDWKKWEEQYKPEALRLVKQLNSARQK